MQRTVKEKKEKSVGVRDLRARASKILRRVREKGETVEITYRGQVIARIVPALPVKPDSATLDAIWADMDRLASEIGRKWPANVTATEAVSEGRR
jgi:prevent-host-death family protein